MAEMDAVRAYMTHHQVMGAFSTWGVALTYRDAMALATTVPFSTSTLGPGDELFIPAGMLIWEECGSSDAAGLKFSMLCPADALRYKKIKDFASKRMPPSAHNNKHVLKACS